MGLFKFCSILTPNTALVMEEVNQRKMLLNNSWSVQCARWRHHSSLGPVYNIIHMSEKVLWYFGNKVQTVESIRRKVHILGHDFAAQKVCVISLTEHEPHSELHQQQTQHAPGRMPWTARHTTACITCSLQLQYYTLWVTKVDPQVFLITLSNIGQYSKFFHWHR